jgi:hypothetical protein
VKKEEDASPLMVRLLPRVQVSVITARESLRIGGVKDQKFRLWSNRGMDNMKSFWRVRKHLERVEERDTVLRNFKHGSRKCEVEILKQKK